MYHSIDEVSSHIANLSAPDGKVREQSAYELFRLGCANAEPILRKWFAAPEFRSLAAGGARLLTVGIAVRPETFEAIRTQFGITKLADVPLEQGAREFELDFAHGVRIDVITPDNPGGDGAIAKFLARFGEGIQQVECDVRDVSRATAILRDRFQLESIYPEARAGANQTRVNFFLVPMPEGKLLIELVESPRKPKKK